MRSHRKRADGGRRWHMNDLLAIELFISVLAILMAATAAILIFREQVDRAQTHAPWLFLRTMQNLWIEERAVAGAVTSDAVLYLRTARGEGSVGTEEGPALGSVRGLEALRSRAARQDLAQGKEEGKKDERFKIGLSDGVPTAVMNDSYTRGPVLLELRPALSSEQSPVVIWLCGREPPPAGWIAAPAREPQVPDIYLPDICRPRMAS